MILCAILVAVSIPLTVFASETERTSALDQNATATADSDSAQNYTTAQTEPQTQTVRRAHAGRHEDYRLPAVTYDRLDFTIKVTDDATGEPLASDVAQLSPGTRYKITVEYQNGARHFTDVYLSIRLPHEVESDESELLTAVLSSEDGPLTAYASINLAAEQNLLLSYLAQSAVFDTSDRNPPINYVDLFGDGIALGDLTTGEAGAVLCVILTSGSTLEADQESATAATTSVEDKKSDQGVPWYVWVIIIFVATLSFGSGIPIEKLDKKI